MAEKSLGKCCLNFFVRLDPRPHNLIAGPAFLPFPSRRGAKLKRRLIHFVFSIASVSPLLFFSFPNP